MTRERKSRSSSAAKLGDIRSMLNLGYFYDNGIGVKRNRASAMLRYKKAYRKGDGCTANNIGTIYRMENNPRRALRWFEKAAELGDMEANLQIAQVYIRDLEDTRAALPYLKRVAGAKPRVNVTEASWEEARLLLKGR